MRILIAAACLSELLTCAVEPALSADTSVVTSPAETSMSRSLDDVRRVIGMNMSSFYALLARARRDKPGLQGEIVLSIIIAPGGTVTKCIIASSTLDHPELERNIVQRFSALEFGTKGTEDYVNPAYSIALLSE